MSEMEQKMMQEMANDAVAEGTAAELAEDDLESVSGGACRYRPIVETQKIYDGKGRECGYTVTNMNFETFYYRCPNCGQPMHLAGYNLECTPCGIATKYNKMKPVKWTKGRSSLIAASTAR